MARRKLIKLNRSLVVSIPKPIRKTLELCQGDEMEVKLNAKNEIVITRDKHPAS